MALLASEIYANSQSAQCTGDDECHWCSAPCRRGLFFHDDLAPVPFVRSSAGARRPANSYCCVACWLYRRRRVCVQSVTGSAMIDGQCPMKHSWFVTRGEARVVRKEDHERLLMMLLDPPRQFYLALLSGGNAADNHLHLAVANDLPSIRADTPIAFTLDNRPLHYTVYELEEALKFDTCGKDPGVQALLRVLHNRPALLRASRLTEPNPVLSGHRSVGRPISSDNTPKRVVCSGHHG